VTYCFVSELCAGSSAMDCIVFQVCSCVPVMAMIQSMTNFVIFQLCTGGSVTDLVQGLKRRNERLTEDQIAYIIREAVEVMYSVVLQCMEWKNISLKQRRSEA